MQIHNIFLSVFFTGLCRAGAAAHTKQRSQVYDKGQVLVAPFKDICSP